MAESYAKNMPAMPKKSNKPAKVMEEMRVKPAENGGVSVTHHFSHYDHAPETHVFGAGDGDKFKAHMMEHSGMKDVGKSEEVGDGDGESNEPEE